ncbi:hypothetical protein PV723_39570 [Streptomyces sp. AK04-3B]|nr:hypothetical protein [Streptomyces sp. AK04-3B]MDX3804720.1 hypothetical protein [Streptomyces sp. AK04-3B]
MDKYKGRDGILAAHHCTQPFHTLGLVMIVEVIHDLESVDLAYWYRLDLPAPKLFSTAV